MLKEVVLILLSGFGFSLTYYIWKRIHKERKKLVCMIGDGGCDKVVKSKYGHIFGVDNTILGMIFYALIFLAGISYFVYPSIVSMDYFVLGLKVIVSLAALMSVFLTLVQFFVLKQFCEYCAFANAINILVFLAVWFL